MNNEIKLVNITQVKCYLCDGVEPKRMELGLGRKLIFIYDKEESQECFDKWKNKEYDLSIFDSQNIALN
ncbi:MAG: hypothetical protein R3Y35_07185 [Clostridia bacterium]